MICSIYLEMVSEIYWQCMFIYGKKEKNLGDNNANKR